MLTYNKGHGQGLFATKDWQDKDTRATLLGDTATANESISTKMNGASKANVSNSCSTATSIGQH